MGWNSATEIMDMAFRAAEIAVRNALLSDPPPYSESNMEIRLVVDDHLRLFVRTLAGHLRDGDWDNMEESEFFDRFAQEMLGHGNIEHERWLIEKVIDTEADPEWVERLTNFRARIKADIRAGKYREES